MINPLTPIAAAAASVGITSTIEVGDEQELNLVLHNQTDFPLLALVRTGIDAERNTFVPAKSYSYNTKHVCLCYLLSKSNLDDTGTARNTAIQALYETAMQLAARIQTDGATSVQLRQPGKLSLSALPVNMFDLNLDGVIFMAEIPDSFTYCVPLPDLALYAWDAGDIQGTTQTLTFSGTGETIDVSTNAVDFTSPVLSSWVTSTEAALHAAGYTSARMYARRTTSGGLNRGLVWIWGLPDDLGTVTLVTSAGSFVATLQNDVTYTASDSCVGVVETISMWYAPGVDESVTSFRISGGTNNPTVGGFSINIKDSANWPSLETKVRELVAQEIGTGTERGYAKLIDGGGEEAFFLVYGITTGPEPVSLQMYMTTTQYGEVEQAYIYACS